MKTWILGVSLMLATAAGVVWAAAPGGGAASSAPAAGAAGGAQTKAWVPPVFKEREKDREAMVKYVRDFYGMKDEKVLEALMEVPRHEYCPADLQAQAYDDSPLPIAYGQLITQPCIVGLMTAKLNLKKDSKVLEIGTGSGYQASILTNLTPNVYTVEIIKPLGEAAAERIKRLGYSTVRTKIGDGFNGWAEEAPFDAIIVTCAAGQIPPPLLKQLKPGGVMMIPVGQPFAMQSLMMVTKDADGLVRSESLQPVRFVPLLGSDPTTQASTGPATAPK